MLSWGESVTTTLKLVVGSADSITDFSTKLALKPGTNYFKTFATRRVPVTGSILKFEIEDKSAIKVILNGKKLTFDAPAKIINDRTMVSLRFVSEAMGCQVNWEGVTRTCKYHSVRR